MKASLGLRIDIQIEYYYRTWLDYSLIHHGIVRDVKIKIKKEKQFLWVAKQFFFFNTSGLIFHLSFRFLCLSNMKFLWMLWICSLRLSLGAQLMLKKLQIFQCPCEDGRIKEECICHVNENFLCYVAYAIRIHGLNTCECIFHKILRAHISVCR